MSHDVRNGDPELLGAAGEPRKSADSKQSSFVDPNEPLAMQPAPIPVVAKGKDTDTSEEEEQSEDEDEPAAAGFMGFSNGEMSKE